MIVDYLSFSPRNPLPAVFIGAFTILVTFGLSAVRALELPNGVLYDLAVRSALNNSIQSERVLVITGEPSDLHAQAEPWLRTLQILEELGAKQIVFAIVPENASPAFYSTARVRGNVVFGRGLQAAGGTTQLKPWPAGAQNLNLPFGVVATPPNVYGVHRAQRTVHRVGDESYPDLAYEAAQRYRMRKTGLPKGTYFVNFLGGAGRLPQVSLTRLLNRGLIPELVRDRTVIVGLTQDIGLDTPVTDRNKMMSLPVFQAYALDTLVENRWIRTTPLWVTAIMLCWITLISVVVYQWTEIRLASWLTALLVTIYAASAWLLLSFAQVWSPLVELLIAQIICFLLIARHKTLANEESFRDVLLATSTRLKERVVIRDFNESKDPWPQLISFVQHILDLDRLVFLERIPDRSFVRVGRGYQCTEADISEKRRDYRREPYSTALAENRPIPLERDFLDPRENEEQYLVPLRHGTEILGFWAFGIQSSKARAMPRFLTVADQFSSQMGHLLYQRIRSQTDRESEYSMVSRYLRLEGGAISRGPLAETVGLLVRRLETLEWALNSVETPIAAYDLFGQIMHVNDAMTSLLKEQQLRVYEMTALDLLATLSDSDGDYARSVFQHVALSGEAITLNATLGAESKFLLNIAPLMGSKGELESVGDKFELRGMIFQMSDISPLQQPIEMREESLQHVMTRLRNDMGSIMLVKGLLEDKQQPNEMWGRAVGILSEKITDMIEMMDEAQQYVAEEDIERLTRYPIDPVDPLRAAIDSVQAVAKQRQVDIQSDTPQLISLALAQSDELTAIFTTILEVLIEDAVDGTTINVVLEEPKGWIRYRFTNEGYGIPNEHFQSFLTGSDDVTALEFQALRNAVRQVQHWEGDIGASSEVGVGMRFRIDLHSFLGLGSTAPEATGVVRSFKPRDKE